MDTHFTEEVEQDIRNGHEARFNSFSFKLKGVAIFFNNDLDLKIHEQSRKYIEFFGTYNFNRE